MENFTIDRSYRVCGTRIFYKDRSHLSRNYKSILACKIRIQGSRRTSMLSFELKFLINPTYCYINHCFIDLGFE